MTGSFHQEIRDVLRDAKAIGCRIDRSPRTDHIKIFGPDGSFWGHQNVNKKDYRATYYIKTIREKITAALLTVEPPPCVVCGAREALRDEDHARRILRLRAQGTPYLCAACIKLDRATAPAPGPAPSPLPPLAVVDDRPPGPIEPEAPAVASPIPEEVTPVANICDICKKECASPQGLAVHKTRAHGRKRANGAVQAPALAAPRAAAPARTPEYVEIKFSVLGQALSYDEFIQLTDELLAVREKMRRPLSLSAASSASSALARPTTIREP